KSAILMGIETPIFRCMLQNCKETNLYTPEKMSCHLSLKHNLSIDKITKESEKVKVDLEAFNE
ncbi:3723_t:CDS:1, partial [Entrophospora sp. SA101]